MLPAWVRGNRSGRYLALLLLLTGCAAIAQGRQIPETPGPAPRTIILPQKSIAGAPATLAVLDASGRLLPGIAVELSGGQKVTTDATGRALFIAPRDPGVLIAKLIAKIPGRKISANSTVVASEESAHVPAPLPAPENASPGVRIISYPKILAIPDRFTIQGVHFRGQADLDRVFLGDQLCLVVAASPVSLVVLPGPHVPIGPVALRVRVNEIEAERVSVTMVRLEFTGPADAPNAGTQGQLTLRVQGSTDRLAVEIRNGSPDIIQLSLARGNILRLATSGGEDNIAPVFLRFLASGNYTLTARLLSTSGGLPDIESARRSLVDARKISRGNMAARIGHVIDDIDQAPENVSRTREDLKRILDGKPDGKLAFFLDSAWRALQ